MPTSIFVLACALVFCGLAGPASAQQGLGSLESLIRGEELQALSASDLPHLNQDLISDKARLPGSLDADKTRIGQDRDIDPDAYIVGPNDVLQLYIWGEFDKPYTLQIDPEGYVLIPTVGSFHISGLSLTVAKERLSTAVQNKYPNVAISISPREYAFLHRVRHRRGAERGQLHYLSDHAGFRYNQTGWRLWGPVATDRVAGSGCRWNH